jgi:hypothetical protein
VGEAPDRPETVCEAVDVVGSVGGKAGTLPSRGLTCAIVYRADLEAIGTKSCYLDRSHTLGTARRAQWPNTIVLCLVTQFLGESP